MTQLYGHFLLNFQVNGEFGSDMVCCDWCYLLNVDRQLPLVSGANVANTDLIAWQHQQGPGHQHHHQHKYQHQQGPDSLATSHPSFYLTHHCAMFVCCLRCDVQVAWQHLPASILPHNYDFRLG